MDRQHAGQARTAPVQVVGRRIRHVDEERFGKRSNDEVDAKQVAQNDQQLLHDLEVRRARRSGASGDAPRSAPGSEPVKPHASLVQAAALARILFSRGMSVGVPR